MKPLLLWKSNKHYMFVCVCARVDVRARGRVHARVQPSLSSMQRVCVILWPLWLHIFRHYLIKGTIFGKEFSEISS
jgi:hypothetical protein